MNDVTEIFAFMDELEACGAVCAELVLPWTEDFARLDALTMSQHPACVGCESRPDVPAAIIDIYAAEGATVTMPVPVCEACWSKGRKRLAIRTQKVIRKLAPDALIHFVMEE